MSDSINKLVDTLIKAIDQRQAKKTKGYSTQAEVLRVQNGTAWVHIPGGADETPVQETISCKKGDTVQVRVEGGKATLTGNQSAPPTDDTKAEKAQETADDAAKVAEGAKQEAEGTSQYFWYMNGTSSEAGAHVTEVPASDFRKKPSGGNILMRSNSIKIRNAQTILAEFNANGMKVYKNGSEVASFGSSTILTSGNYRIVIDTTNGFQFQEYNSNINAYSELYRLDDSGIGGVGNSGFSIGFQGVASIYGNYAGVELRNGNVDLEPYIGSGKVTVNGLDPLNVVKLVEDNLTVNGSDGEVISFIDSGGDLINPLGVVGFNVENATSSGIRASSIIVRAAYVSGGDAYMKVENRSTSNAKIKATVYVLNSNFVA